MPTFYGQRKTNRGAWTQENLDKALKDLQKGNVSIREVALNNNIPEKTLRTRLKQNNFIKGRLVAAEDSKNVQARQCTERGETITVVACCNAEGSFLPPYCIFKGVRKQKLWEENMPPGSVIQIRKESAYINEQLFMDWLKNHFIPRKSREQCLLILDGHRSYINSPDILQMATDNNIHILCLPSHTTDYFQPLDRAFFEPLKTYFRDACCEWGNANPNKKIGRNHFGLLLTKAWLQAATVETGISGFRETGIHPFCPSAIPEHAYLENAVQHEESSSSESDKEILPSTPVTNLLSTQMCIMTDESMAQPGPSNLCQQRVFLDTSQKNECENECVECYESYDNTLPKVNWIQCIKCNKWLHETCTLYYNICNLCKRMELKRAKEDKDKKKFKEAKLL
ncbi:uncharacterized protein [Temnothorax longispinosus]|uniref:uncharacterized protein isoform X2 n=1 Tax=Temnothorax longispinosus TaxID=300112 RepID=UPI003A99CFF5